MYHLNAFDQNISFYRNQTEFLWCQHCIQYYIMAASSPVHAFLESLLPVHLKIFFNNDYHQSQEEIA